MRLTDNPCHYCEKRTVDCRITCPRYKVYEMAKSREYARRIQANRERYDMVNHIRSAIDKREKKLVKYTPPKNDGIKWNK